MSNARERIQRVLEHNDKWFTQQQMMAEASVNVSDCSVALRVLLDEGVAQVMKPPAGYARGAQRIYANCSLPSLEGALPLTRLPIGTLRSLPKKLRGFRAEGKAKRKNAKLAKRAAAAVAPRHPRPDDIIVTTTPPRWALASDGALILLDTGTEISKPAARSLIEFVRTLDAGAA